MSVMRAPLNLYLRLTEKRHMARAADPKKLRSSFETKARLFFHGPWNVRPKETAIAGRFALEIVASQGSQVLYFHGGGYVFGSPKTHSAMLATLSKLTGGRAVLPQYSLAPEHPFPAAIEDAESIWRTMPDPQNTVIGGDSAGGGLALALLGVIMAKGLEKPRGVFAFSPLTDMTYSAPSLSQNAQSDVVLPAARVGELNEMVLGGQDPKDPRASPLFAQFDGAPPVFLRVGDTEILHDDTVNMANHLASQGVEVDVKIEHDLPHVWPIFHNILPEGRRTLREVANWIKQLPSSKGES